MIEIDSHYLLLCQGDFPPYLSSLREISPSCISVVSCKHPKEEGVSEDFFSVDLVREYFFSGEVEERAFSRLKALNFKAIIATSETDILRAAKLRQFFSVNGQLFESAIAFRDKIIMKTLLEKEGVSVPKFARIRSTCDLLDFISAHYYPFIVKPTRGYGSLRTQVLKTDLDISLLLSQKGIFSEFHDADINLEEFVSYPMYHIDGIVRNRKVIVLWPSKCIHSCLEMTFGKPTGGYLLGLDNPNVRILNEFALKVLEILPTPSDTGFHLELFYEEGKKPIFCEIASRIGGPWINDLWVNGMDIHLKTEFIRAQALLPPFSKACADFSHPKHVVGGIIFPPRKGTVINLPEHCDLPNVIDYTPLVKQGDQLEDPEGMLDHIASFTLKAETEEILEKTIVLVEKWFNSYLQIY